MSEAPDDIRNYTDEQIIAALANVKLTPQEVDAVFTGDTKAINTEGLRDLRPLALGDDGRIKVLPASFWHGTTTDERGAFGHRTGIYSFPTVELVEHLKKLIGDRSAIEIGAGHGVLAEALGIPATDNFQQRMPKYEAIYKASGQALVPYGPNVIDMHASRAVRHYKPQVVIGCWVTHKFDPAREDLGGNEIGIDERDILLNCASYVFVGNRRPHALKPIWDRPHTIEEPDYVYSRAHTDAKDFIAVWRGSKR